MTSCRLLDYFDLLKWTCVLLNLVGFYHDRDLIYGLVLAFIKIVDAQYESVVISSLLIIAYYETSP